MDQIASVASFFVSRVDTKVDGRLMERVDRGRAHRSEPTDIKGIPCSGVIEAEVRRLRIPLTTLEDHAPGPNGRVIDLTFDGADEVDPALNLIKGGGGAQLHEKIVAQASRREIIIVDESKLSPALGTHWAIPVEVIPFGWRTQATYL